ncbi:hypothetical protein ACIQ6K_39390 [Streptomyces sp. NPDC096354]|uniref:hypothetical protein n=1 Tax=Streptomyces sp. NPDC096354 TaxID=3366088 RepID=UPI0037FC55C4
MVALGLLGEPATGPFIESYLDSPIVELCWASAFALTRLGIAGTAVVDVLTQVVALRAVDAMLAGLADCTGVERYYDRYYTAQRLFTLVFSGEPAEPPQSFGDLSDVQQRVVRCVADQDEAAWPYPAMDTLSQWKVPTGHSDLRAYVGSV